MSGQQDWWVSGSKPNDVHIVLPASDATSDLEVATDVVFIPAPFDFDLTEVFATVKTAPDGDDIEIDINKAGTSVLASPLIIADGDTSSLGVSQPVTKPVSFTKGQLIAVDIDQIGSSTAGVGLVVVLIGYRR